MADAVWITEDYFYANSVIASNADWKVVEPNIEFVQDAYIKPLLGTDLFNIVQAEINAQVYTARITTLLNDHIKKVLMNYVLAESAHDFSIRWMNKGLMKKNSENSTPADQDEVKVTHDRFKNRAEIFEARAKNFLIENSATYPEYYTGNTGLDDIRPNQNSFRTGIYLGDEDDNDCDYRKRNV
jgi:hypothetical protein